jgi:hypothetical protein
MTLITPADVNRRVELYYDREALQFPVSRPLPNRPLRFPLRHQPEWRRCKFCFVSATVWAMPFS